MSSLLGGCYTTTNTVTVAPLKTKYPVSASGQYLDKQGNIVKEEQYEIVKSFEFDKQIEAPRHETKETDLAIDSELDSLVSGSRGDAVTDLNIAATEYDTGSHGSAAGWKVLGWSFGLTGATFMVMGAAVDDEGTGVSGTFVTVGAVFAGLGLLSYLASYAADDPAAWNIHVEGNVVRQGAAPAPSKTEEVHELSYIPMQDLPEGAILVPAPGFRPLALSQENSR